jgi:hypothetical protein
MAEIHRLIVSVSSFKFQVLCNYNLKFTEKGEQEEREEKAKVRGPVD